MFLGTTVLIPTPNKHILPISFFFLFISVAVVPATGPPDSHRIAELRYSLPKSVSIILLIISVLAGRSEYPFFFPCLRSEIDPGPAVELLAVPIKSNQIPWIP